MVINYAVSIPVDPAQVKLILINHDVSYAGGIVEKIIRLVSALAVADADDPVPFGKIGFRLERIVEIIAAVLCRGSCLQHHHNGMPCIQLLPQRRQ